VVSGLWSLAFVLGFCLKQSSQKRTKSKDQKPKTKDH